MSTGLDWQMDEEGDEPPEFQRGRWPVTSLALIAAVIVFIALAFGVWGAGRDQAAKRDERLEASVQDALDLMHRAYLAGDGDLFFANQASDPAWLSAQLLPVNQFFYAAGPTVTRVEQFGNDIWANVQWQEAEAGQTLQRVAFFQWQNGRLIQAPAADSYWGPVERVEKAFGRLQLHEVDQQWQRDIASFAVRVMAENCGSSAGYTCRPDSHPFTLTISSDYSPTVVPGQLRVPSPRLLGLDERGRPSTLFWNQLRQTLEAHFNPATVRFAVPEEFLNHYQEAAAAFSAAQPDISVETITLESLPADPLAWPAEIDGAAMTPNERMITAGRVLDLTGYVIDDPDFNEGDFYEQIWQGGWWRERMWFMPQAADMRLLFYDRAAYQRAGLAEPSLRWTWDEMNKNLADLASSPESERFSAIFLDPGRDTLFSYALNLDNDCPGQATVFCIEALSTEAVGRALEWYYALLAVDGMTVDLTMLSPAERDHAVINLVSPRNVLVWAEQPVLFEHHILYQPTGVVPFPGSERFDGITPLWVQGSFISQFSQQPLATWEWLKFLSYQSLARQKRLVPARPSVAIASDYWTKLPRPVSEAMRIAFPFARPVLIEEQDFFAWDQLAAIASGEQTPGEVLEAMARTRWFGREAR